MLKKGFPELDAFRTIDWEILEREMQWLGNVPKRYLW